MISDSDHDQPTIKSLENDPRILYLSPDEPYYNPSNGLYIPAKSKKCAGFHGWRNIYWDPCLDCERFCNCSKRLNYPDMMVTTLDKKDFRVSRFVVGASEHLIYLWLQEEQSKELRERKRGTKRKIQEHDVDGTKIFNHFGWIGELRHGKWSYIEEGDEHESDLKEYFDKDYDDNNNAHSQPKRKLARKQVVDTDKITELLSNLKTEENNVEDAMKKLKLETEDDEEDLDEWLEFPQNKLFDLRKGNNEPTFGITEAQWKFIEKFVCHHLDQVDENVAAKRRMQTFFKFNLHKIPQAEPINYWKCYDWEMDLFEEIPHTEMFEIIQAMHELRIKDMLVPVEKWLSLYRGIPNIQDAGWGQYLADLCIKEDGEQCRERCSDFMWIPPAVLHNSTMSFHCNIPNRQDRHSSRLWPNRVGKRLRKDLVD